MSKTNIKKADEHKRLVTAEVYAPNIPDAHGDFMTAEEIEKMAFGFIKEGRIKFIDVQHDNKLYDCALVESFIAREDDKLFIPGSWVVTVHVPNEEVWRQILDVGLNSFSMEVMTYKKESEAGCCCRRQTTRWYQL